MTSTERNATIQNVRFEDHFTVTSNFTAEDCNISWGAKGLLWYIISRHKNWIIHSWQLAKIYKGKKKGGGITAIYSYLKELKEAGYIEYKKSKNAKGQWEHSYKVYPMPIKQYQKLTCQKEEKPQENREESQKIIPHIGNPSMVLPDIVNPSILINTDLPITDLKNPPLSSPPEKSPQKKKPDKISLRSEEEEFFLNKLLEKTILSPKDKKRLLKMPYTKEQIQEALVIARSQKVKKSFMGMLINILDNPEEWSSEEKLSPKQQIALNYNKKLAKVNEILAKNNEELIKKNIIKVLEKYNNQLYEQQISLNTPDFEKEMKQYEKYLE